MLSVLITIYHYNLYPLVQQLHQQCVEAKIPFEILTQDDASHSIHNLENEKINSLTHARFFVLENNVGYRENKNLLAQKAKYPWLLILDGDCVISQENFIQNYLDAIPKNVDGVYGGRKHPEVCPSNQQKLRWKYGKFMEDNPLENRLKKPYESFLFNNTLIKKSVFDQVKFDASFQKYGHDDTLFSFELKRIGAKLHHINNPVIHNDLDTNEVFYQKTKGAMDNLIYLYQKQKIPHQYTKLLTLIYFLQTIKMTFLVGWFYGLFQNFIEKNLTGENPSLFWFNYFRLGYVCQKITQA